MEDGAKPLECGPDGGGTALNASKSGTSQAQGRTPRPPAEGVYGDLLYVDPDDLSKVKRVGEWLRQSRRR